MSDLYLHYKAALLDAATQKDFDRVIQSAFNDYMRGRLDENEYGRIYFAAIAKCN